MHRPWQAMLWACWRVSRVELLWRLAVHCLLVAFVLSQDVASGSMEAAVLRTVTMLMLAGGCVFSMTWLNSFDNRTAGFSFRLGFVTPVSTVQLVGVPLVFLVTTSLASFVVPALLMTWLAGLHIPIVPMGQLLAVVVLCLVATAWCPTTMAGRWASLATVGLGIVTAALAFHAESGETAPFFLAAGKPGYLTFEWHHYAVMIAAASFAVTATIISVDRQRHGDHLSPWWSVRPATTEIATPTAIVSRPPFRSPFFAQCWYEFRRIGPTMVYCGLFAPLFPLLFVCAAPFIDPSWRGMPGIWLAALAVCPLVYQLIGAERAIGLQRTSGRIALAIFDGTRPLRNDQLVASKLLAVVAGSLIGWSLMAIAALAHSAVIGNWADWSRILGGLAAPIGDVPGHWWLVALVNVVLLYISSTSMLLAFGLWVAKHEWLFGGATVLLALHSLLAIWDAKRDWSLLPLWTVYGYLVAAAIVGVSLWAIRAALVRGLLGPRIFLPLCCLWGTYVATAAYVYSQVAEMVALPATMVVVGTSTLLLVLAATPFATLSVASYRNG